GVEPRCSIALEDSPAGTAAAEAAGYRTVAVPSVVPVPAAPGRGGLPSLAGVTLADLAARSGVALGWRGRDRAREGERGRGGRGGDLGGASSAGSSETRNVQQ